MSTPNVSDVRLTNSTVPSVDIPLNSGNANSIVVSAFGTNKAVDNTAEKFSIQSNKNQKEINELKNKINNLCSLLGTTSEQVFGIFGQNIKFEENLTVDECNKRIEALNTAIKDATVNGKLDKQKAINLAKDYVIALNTGWSIQGLIKQNKAVGETSLQQRLIDLGYLKKTKDGTINEKDAEVAIKRFFNDFFNDKIKNAKTQQEKEKIAIQQKQTFGRLLVNTKGEERELFTKVIAYLYQENRVDGTKNMFISAVDDEQKHLMAAKLKEEMPKIAEDLKGDALIQIETIRVINLSAEDKKQLPNENKIQWQNFFSKYNEADIKEAINFYKNNTPVEQIPEKYKEILKEYTYLINISSGDKTGLAVKDNNFSVDEQLILNKELDSNIKSFGADTYDAVQLKTAEFVDKNSENLNISKEDIAQILDKASDGQFSNIVRDSGVTQNLVKGDAASSTGVGLEQKATQETYWSTVATVDNKIQELYKKQQKEEKQSFIIEKPFKQEDQVKTPWQKFQSIKGLSAKDILDGIANKYIKFNDVIDKYNELTQSAKDLINNFIESMSTGIQYYILSGLKDNVVLAIAEHTNIDFSKLDLKLTCDAQKQLQIIQNRKQALSLS